MPPIKAIARLTLTRASIDDLCLQSVTICGVVELARIVLSLPNLRHLSMSDIYIDPEIEEKIERIALLENIINRSIRLLLLRVSILGELRM